MCVAEKLQKFLELFLELHEFGEKRKNDFQPFCSKKNEKF